MPHGIAGGVPPVGRRNASARMARTPELDERRAVGRLCLEADGVVAERHPRLGAAGPDVRDRCEPRRILERPGPEDQHVGEPLRLAPETCRARRAERAVPDMSALDPY